MWALHKTTALVSLMLWLICIVLAENQPEIVDKDYLMNLNGTTPLAIDKVETEKQTLSKISVNFAFHAKADHPWIILTIDVDVLKSILNSSSPLTFVHEAGTELFLNKFKHFLIPFSWDEPEKNDVMKVVAEYNQRHFSFRPDQRIKLLVSFQPREDIREDIKVVTDAIAEINSIFWGTVHAVVLDYNFLQLETQSILLVNHEMRIVREKINSLAGKRLFFALQLDLKNCKSRMEFIQNLTLGYVDTVLLSEPTGQTEDQDENAGNFADHINCLSFFSRKQLPQGVTTYISIKIDTGNSSFAYDRNLFKRFVHINNFSSTPIHLIFWTEVDTQSQIINSTNRAGMSDLNSLTTEWVNWLQKPVHFRKEHFGGVISAEQQMSKNILENFYKIIIEVSEHALNARRNVEQILTELHRHSSSTQGSDKYKEVGMEIQVILVITITKNDFELNARQVDTAVWAAWYWNELNHHGALAGIVFDWLACGMSEECSGYNNTNPNVYCSVFEMDKDIRRLTRYTRETINKLFTGIAPVLTGMSLDGKLYAKFLRASMYRGCEDNEPIVGILMFAVKFVLREEDLRKKGPTSMFSKITAEFIANTHFLKKEEHFQIYYHVRITGCTGNYSSARPLAEYALLYERLNTWAVTRKATLYVDAITENSETCGQRHNDLRVMNCNCGFWVSTNTSVDDQPTAVHIHNKKEIALKLYEKSRKLRGSNEDTSPPRTPVNNPAVYWVLVPLLLLAVLITVTAIILVFHYRSKYVMTREEVANFLKGRIQGSRATQDVNRDEMNPAEGEPYNSEKYELKPSSFKIDESCCVGTGEFGKVFKGTISRPGGIADSAVKVANTRALTKSYGGRMALFGLLSEIKILAYLGEHEHIVGLLGAFTANLRKGEIAVFLEFCELGSLYTYLRSIQPDRQVVSPDLDEDAIPLLEIVTEDHANSSVLKENYVNSTVLKKDNAKSTELKEDYVNSSVLKEDYVNSAVLKKDNVNSTVLKDDYVNSSVLKEDYVNSTVLKKDNVNSTVLKAGFVNSTALMKDYVNSTVPKKDIVKSTVLTLDYVNSAVLTEQYVNSTVLTADNVNSAVQKKEKVNSIILTENNVNSTVEKRDKVDSALLTEHYPLPSALCDELYGYGGQIACGMEYLVSKNVVHADLATRNVLLTKGKVAKICDFGLSRRMYEYTEYVKRSQAPLPWQWMAPESLRRKIFNEKSDVWAFGVLLWEIFTLGDEPYPGLSWQENFPARLERGLQLPAPKYNVKQIHSVMKQCWNTYPTERPTFAELILKLNQVHARLEQY